MNDHPLTPQQAAAWASYQRMRARLTGRLGRDLASATGLSEADYEILMVLIASPNESMRALALRCGLAWEKSRLSHQLQRMEQRGLLTREQCAEDSRSTLIRITPQGRALAAQAQRHYDQAVRQYVMGVLSADQVEALGEIAEAVLAQLEEPHRP